MNKTKQFRDLSIEEIQNRISELRKEIMKENVHISSGTAPSNSGKLKQNKKNIARLLTVLGEKKEVVK